MNRPLLLCILWMCVVFSACTQEPEQKKHVIGLSQCLLGDAWRQAMINDVRIEVSNYDDVDIIIKDAHNSNEKQIEQIRELIRQQVDVLIISPYQSEPITSVAEEAYRAGIPTIITDRKVNTDLYTTFVGANNYEIGRAAGMYAAQSLSSQAVILELWGLKETSPAAERHQGFVDALAGRDDLTFRSIEGEWLYDTACVRLRQHEPFEQIDLVYAHNDMMAIAARDYFMEIDSVRYSSLPIVGVDAVYGAGLDAVVDGRVTVSFLYPTGGEQVIRAVMQIIQGKTVDKFIPLHTGKVDKEVAQTLLLQTGQLQNYKRRIETQRSRIDNLLGRYLFLQNSLLLISLLMAVLIILSVYVFYVNKKVRVANRKLRETNRKEEEQRRKLILLNAEIKEVTSQKLQFFTNVSHEVRTPLTLIIAPLDRLITLLQDSPYLSDLELVKKNADRLLRVINQILDFRKVENNQEKLNIREVDVVPFAGEVKSYFDSMASVRNITYSFETQVQHCLLWMDPDLMERVLVNLLSNAFKFTPEGGDVTLRLREDDQHFFLEVEDSGCGIDPEQIDYLFNRFYTANRSEGTGIGLHLVKEYVKMHGGEIKVVSQPHVQTLFTVVMQKGKAHFAETVTEMPILPLAYEAAVLDDTMEKTLLGKNYPYTVLIAEDDDEVRSFLARELSFNFQVLTAVNGRDALQIIDREEEISLVLSDVMMPEMNGFELCRSLKTTLSTSHIPVVLLTALSDERQRIFGVSRGADVYIQKPFHVNYVKITIIRLLEERHRLREQLLQQLQEKRVLLTQPEKVESLDDVFLRRFLEQIEKVYADPDYNVEKLSDTLGLSRGHLHRKIKELTGKTPVEFLRNYRLSQAASLLRQKAYSVSEVAYQTGFSSPAYFAKCFKAVYQVTPTEFT